MLRHEDIEAYLGHQRWFAGKGRSWRVSAELTVGWLREDMPAVRIALVTIAYDDGSTETYQLPLVHHAGQVDHLQHAFVGEDVDEQDRHTFCYDALHDKDATPVWIDGIAASTSGSGWQFHPEATVAELPPTGPSLVIGAEQSNTSVIYGDTIILKTFRKVAPGLNPDIEVHSALAAAGNTNVVPLLGWLEGDWHDPGQESDAPDLFASLAMAAEFLPNATDGWELAMTSVRDLYAEADLHADEVGGDFAGEAHRLGVATAEVHAGLAATLPTGTIEGKELSALADGMRTRLDLAVLEIPDLAPFAQALAGAFDDLAALPDPVPVQRVHGDYHLGQVMRTVDGWKILDFEGEPARPLEERRALDCIIKDVAGMLRSFDYAARHLLADHPGDIQREYRAREWADRNRDAFCRGYATGGGQDPRKQDVLLRAFETDKAVYEAVYEARNRPSWLGVPMSAIRRLAADEASGERVGWRPQSAP